MQKQSQRWGPPPHSAAAAVNGGWRNQDVPNMAPGGALPPQSHSQLGPRMNSQSSPSPGALEHRPAPSASASSQPADFDAIRKECQRRHVLYEDPDFPANDRSLYYSRTPPYHFEWLRPREIAGKYGLKPELFVDGASRFDLTQGKLGDCWVVAAVACMSENMEIVYRVLPRGQSFHDSWYAGMFHFLFWRYGKWEEVIIDDRLPTVKGELMFIHSRTRNEFWSALLEKAYAKLHGSYEALKSGHVSDCLTDLTGGLTESYVVRGSNADLPRNIVNIMFKSLERQSLIGCAINPISGGSSLESILPNGLVAGHAYSITDLREIRLISDRGEIPITLVRVRNPWGSRIEWDGPWSDRSQEWNSIPPQDREAMGLVYRDDGEFWMDFRDFVSCFDSLDICNLTPDSPIETPRRWKVSAGHARWKRGVTAGGRPSCSATHWTNPQFKMVLKDSDDDEDNMCSFIVELMQKDRRKMKHKGLKNVSMGFVVYKCPKDIPVPLSRSFLERNHYIESVNYFTNSRQIVKRFLLPPGDYVIVPSTYDPDIEADFLLRVFFENNNSAEIIDGSPDTSEPTPVPPDPSLMEREDKIKQMFYEIAGESMEIDAFEFRKVLNNVLRSDPNHKDISLDACRSMVAVVDVDQSGKLGVFEFLYLWNYLRVWKKNFYSFDRNDSGSIDSFELREAIASQGYRVSSRVISALVFRYADEKYKIDLDNFIICMAKLMALHNVFKKYQKNGRATFALDEWLEQALMV